MEGLQGPQCGLGRPGSSCRPGGHSLRQELQPRPAPGALGLLCPPLCIRETGNTISLLLLEDVAVGAQRSLPTSPVLTRGLLNKMWTSAWVLERQATGSCNIRLQEDVVKHLGAWQRATPRLASCL